MPYGLVRGEGWRAAWPSYKGQVLSEKESFTRASVFPLTLKQPSHFPFSVQQCGTHTPNWLFFRVREVG